MAFLGSNTAWLCILNSQVTNYKKSKRILIGSYRNLCNLSSARPSLFSVTSHRLWVQQFQSISVLLMSSVLFLLPLHWADELSWFTESIETLWGNNPAILFLFNSDNLSYFHSFFSLLLSFFSWLIPAICVWSYCHRTPTWICLFLVSLGSPIYHLFVIVWFFE